MTFADAWRYWKFVVAQAGRRTLTHAHQKLLLGLILSVLATALQFVLQVRSLSDTAKITISILGSAVVVIVGSFLKHLIFAPPSIHEEQQQRLQQQEGAIQDLKGQLERPSLSPREQTNREFVGKAIYGASEAELRVLNCILNHGEIEAYQLERAIKDRDAIASALGRWLHELVGERVEQGTNRTTYFIIPGRKPALMGVDLTEP